MLPPPMARPTAAESSCPVAASRQLHLGLETAGKDLLVGGHGLDGVEKTHLRHDDRDGPHAGRGCLASVIATWSLTTSGAGVGDDLELLREFLLESAPEIGGQRLLVRRLHLVVSSPQNVTGSMMILVYWRHCADGLKYRRPTWPFRDVARRQ